jgi:hypothetical protein
MRLAALLFIFVSGSILLAGIPVVADVPNPNATVVPGAIPLSPGPRFPSNPIGGYNVHVEGPLGPLQGVLVEVEISPEADALIAWCEGQAHPIQSGFTDANGNKTFTYFGGGCVLPEDIPQAAYVAEVRFDGVAQQVHPYVASPDVVNIMGERAVSAGGACENNQSTVGLSDATYHTVPIMTASHSACSKFTPPFNGAVGIPDAVSVTPYIKSGSSCACN